MEYSKAAEMALKEKLSSNNELTEEIFIHILKKKKKKKKSFLSMEAIKMKKNVKYKYFCISSKIILCNIVNIKYKVTL